ncbi:PAS domain S-box protein [Hwanghaeella grinnelliae]|uniref:histidine kinase n=1 Tax=Hwanghaeella grinnelliae TaxID=2500179 RepID=A0A437QQS3_9PROT|nr:ATP-binding protein [Hwanghaeella grinnelliae]RVU36807.1 PAS domain S-box protein [Hwanghaeella grinnelliae]
MKALRGNSFVPNGNAALLLIAGIVALGIIGLGAYVERLKTEQLRYEERSGVVDRLANIRTRLEGAISDSVGRVEGVVAYIERNPDLTEEDYSAFVSRLITDRSQILNVAAAPGLVVEYVFPKEGNEAVIGLDYRRTPAQWQAARRAFETGRLSMAGPVDLVQGGTGFIARAPVFVEREGNSFWGLVSAVIDTDLVYDFAGLNDPDLDLDIAIRGRDAMGRSGGVFFGSVADLGINPVELDVTVPNGKWVLIATPKAGWYAREFWDHLEVFVAAGFATLLILLTIAFTYHRKTRRVLRQRLENLSRAVDQSSAGLVIASARGYVVYANPGFLGMSQQTEAETVGSHVRTLFNEGDLPVGFRALWRSVLAGNDWQGEQQNWRKDGTPYWESIAISPVKNAQGETADVLIVKNDISDKKNFEEALVRAKLGAEAANRSKSQFLASMSHELRTPLNAILGFAQMLAMNLDHSLSERHHSYVDNIVAAGKHLLDLVNDILDLARVEADRMPLELEIVDLNALVQDCVDLTRTAADTRGVTIQDSISAGPAVSVAADPLRLKQVLLNLMSNAVKYNRDGGRVDLACRQADDGMVRISVADTGLGIARRDRDAVFEMFHRLNADPSLAQDGTGIGLTVSKILVERMDGRIGFDSEEGNGSTFWIELPLDLPEAETAPARESDLDTVVAINDLSKSRRQKAG